MKVQREIQLAEYIDLTLLAGNIIRQAKDDLKLRGVRNKRHKLSAIRFFKGDDFKFWVNQANAQQLDEADLLKMIIGKQTPKARVMK